MQHRDSVNNQRLHIIKLTKRKKKIDAEPGNFNQDNVWHYRIFQRPKSQTKNKKTLLLIELQKKILNKNIIKLK